MRLYPAIDIKDGVCIRLVKGAFDQATRYNDDPADQARQFVAAGAEWLHIVDLDGAVAGRPVNTTAIMAIRAAVSVPLQLGGGLRTLADIAYWFDQGMARIILGTASLADPDLVTTAAKRFPNRIILGLDAREGNIATQGWLETSTVTVSDMVDRFAESAIAAVIYTDIARDGTMTGPNIAATARLTKRTDIPVIASGGVGSLEDLIALQQAAPSLEGCVVGRALYDGRIDLRAAIERLRRSC